MRDYVRCPAKSLECFGPKGRLNVKCESLNMASEREFVLAGGNLTTVVRVGDTVRRAAGRWTPFVHRLLKHLRDSGFTLAPEALGLDELGREILSFIPGQTLTESLWPQWVWSDDLLEEAVMALVDYHQKVANFRPSLVESRLGTVPLGLDQIVCHNDFAPYNCVFRDGHLVGLFDWDVVCAGDPSWDLAFFAWHWVPLYPPAPDIGWRSNEVCRRRLRHIVDSYGLSDRSGFVRQIITRIDSSRTGILTRAAEGDAAFIELKEEGHPDVMQQAIDFIRVNEKFLSNALSD